MAEREAERRGPGRYVAEVTRWDGPDSFRVDVAGMDLELDEGFVTISQQVRAYDQQPGISVGDNLLLVEIEEGEFVAVGVESDAELPEPVDGETVTDLLERVTELEGLVAALAAAAIDAGDDGVGVRFGATTYSWPGGSPLSGVVTIDHELGRVPVSIVATPWAQHVALRVVSRSSTQIQVQARTLDGSSPSASSGHSFGWLVFG